MISFYKKNRKVLGNNQAGYTLLELLVVLSILALILGIAIPTVMNQFGKAKTETARIQVVSLAANLEFFFLDVGRYPSAEEGLRVLIEEPEGVRGWGGPYIRQASSLIDPWGQPYSYRLLLGGPGPFEIFSLGRDQKPGGEGEESDISNLEKIENE